MATQTFNLNETNTECVFAFSGNFEKSCEFQVIGNFDGASIDVYRSILDQDTEDYTMIKDSLGRDDLFAPRIGTDSITEDSCMDFAEFTRVGQIKFKITNATSNTNVFIIITNVNLINS